MFFMLALCFKVYEFMRVTFIKRNGNILVTMWFIVFGFIRFIMIYVNDFTYCSASCDALP